MQEQIDGLTPEQAQLALFRFYERSPEEMWEGSKPTPGDLEYLQEGIQKAATPEVEPFLKALQDETDGTVRGETARFLLKQFASSPELRPDVEEAVQEATTPHMAPVPVIAIAAMLVLAATPKKITWEDGKIQSMEFGQLADAAAFVKELPGFVKASVAGLLAP